MSCSLGSLVARGARAGHQHARRAIAALQAVLLPEASWTGCSFAVALEPLDGRDLTAVGLPRQYRARLHRLAVEQHGARPAVVVSQPKCVPVSRKLSRKRCTRRSTRLDVRLARRAVHRHRDLVRAHVTDLPRAGLPASGRAPPAPGHVRLYSTEPADPAWANWPPRRAAPPPRSPRRSASSRSARLPPSCDRTGVGRRSSTPGRRGRTRHWASVTCAAAAAVAVVTDLALELHVRRPAARRRRGMRISVRISSGCQRGGEQAEGRTCRWEMTRSPDGRPRLPGRPGRASSLDGRCRDRRAPGCRPPSPRCAPADRAMTRTVSWGWG